MSDQRFERLVRNQFHAAAFNPSERPALVALLRSDTDVLAFARAEMARTSNAMLQERCHVSKTTHEMLKRAIEEADVPSQHAVTVEETHERH